MTFCAVTLPLQAQVTIDVAGVSDNQAPSVPLHSLEPGAIRAGNIVHSGNYKESNFVSRPVIRLNGVDVVRGSAPSPFPPGDPAPGTTSTFSGFLHEIFVNAGGQIAFTASTAATSNVGGFWVGSPSAPQLVARHNGPAPGTNGTFSINYPGNTISQIKAFNDAGQIAFLARIEGVPNGTAEGFWAGLPGALQLVARQGSQAPNFVSGVTWDYVGDIQLNAAGEVAVFGRVTQTPPAETSLTNGYVLMVGQPGALRIVAKAGDPAPDAEPFTFLRLSDGDFALNSAGQVAYLTDVWSGQSGIVPPSRAIYLGSAGQGSKLVARSNYAAPGTDADAVFGDFDPPVLNASGEVAFAAFVKSAALPVSQGIWTGKPGRMRKVARTNDVAPGTGGQLFGQFQDRGVAISDSGQVAFLATFSPGGGLYGNSATTGLFATDKTGALQLVARAGAAIGSGPVLNEPRLTGGSGADGGAGSGAGKRQSFDQDGRLIFYANGRYNNPATGNDHYAQFVYRATFPEAAPVIPPTGQPLSVRTSPGQSAVFEVMALGSRPASYQWRRNGLDLPGQTSPTLTLHFATTNESGAYTLVVTNASGSATSSPAQLSFPPLFKQQPLDVQVNAGSAASIPLTVTGPGVMSYQWQFKALGAPNFSNVPGATNPALTFPSVTVGQAGRYRAIVTNSEGSTTSREVVFTVAAAGAPLVKRILSPGDPVPGISGSLSFTAAEDPVINNTGGIAFEGNVANDLFGGALDAYFRSPEGNYGFLSWEGRNLNLSEAGQVAMDNNRPTSTIELGPPGSVKPLARRQTQAPDGAGNYDGSGGFALADNGTAAFLFGTHLSPSAVFAGQPGAVRLLGRSNTQAPGLAAGVVFSSMSEPVISPSGTTAFWATLGGAGITQANDTSLWKSAASGIQRIVAEDELVPAAGSGVRVGDIRVPDATQSPFGWNEAGQVSFSTTLAGTGITSANDKAILAGLPGALAVVARDGAANGHTFDLSARSYPVINRTGQVAFIATVTPSGTSDFLESVWRWTPGPAGGTRQLIAREGQQAPGLAAGVIMDSVLLSRPLFACALNGAGQMVITTRLAGPGISFDAQNDLALYITNPAGELKLVARTGGMIDLGGGELNELGWLTVALRSGGEDGRPRSFNESGELVFMGSLKKTGSFASDGSLFTARLTPDTSALTAAYNTWAIASFPAGSGPAVTAPAANPDRDQESNGIEYLTGSSPNTPGGSALTLQPNQPGLTFTFPRRVGVPDGFEIIESSTELEGIWTPVGRTAITRTSNGGTLPDTVTVRLPAGEEQRFVRVRLAF